jgi:hypothetical protein
MKRFSVSMILSVTAFCVLLLMSPQRGYADTIGSVVSLELVGIQGTGYNGEAVYPYYLSVNGSSMETWAMCVSYDNKISIGESWYATIAAITTPQEKEAAWLFNQANLAIAEGNTALQIDDQWAAWEIFSTNAQNATPPDGVAATQLALAEADYALEPDSFYESFVIYIPAYNAPGLPDWPTSAGDLPQNFLGYDYAPEPNSFILLGSGVFGMAALLYWRKRSGEENHVVGAA